MFDIKNESMQNIAQKLLERPKGIFAADESGGSIEKRFADRGIESTEENRRQYRQLFFTTPEIEHYVNGVILFDETARQKSDGGVVFTDYLINLGIIPGIKVDSGVVPLEGFPGETISDDLNGLAKRFEEYREMGIRFSKWRVAFSVGDGIPTDQAINANVHALTRYAMISQAAGIIPIVEPELIYDGDHTIQQAEEKLGYILYKMFEHLRFYNVDLSTLIVKTSQVMAGKRYAVQSTPQEVGNATVKVLKENVPAEVPGVVFLSGGQTPQQAINNLRAICSHKDLPWTLTFSYSRALQDPSLDIWNGEMRNIPEAKQAFHKLLKENSEALNG